MGHEGRASWLRIIAALFLGHLAAAGSFGASATMFGALFDPSASMPPTLDWLRDLAKVAAFFGLVTPIVMLPASLLTSPFTIFAAVKLRAGLGTAVAVGALIGMIWDVLVLISSDGLNLTWSRAGAPGDPRTATSIVACGAIAGMAYAWVVWSRCIRPYLHREGSLRSLQV